MLTMSREMSKKGSYAVDLWPHAQHVTSDRSTPPNTASTRLVAGDAPPPPSGTGTQPGGGLACPPCDPAPPVTACSGEQLPCASPAGSDAG